MPRDLYDILEVAHDASDADIKKSYRRLAMQFHPDRNGGDKAAEERFKEITEAYDVLRDPDKRARYDRYGMAGITGPTGGGGFHPFDLSEALRVFMQDFGGMSGLESLFGGSERSRTNRRQGQDIRLTLKLSVAESLRGANRKVKLRSLEVCKACGGRGGAKGSNPETCRTCRGTGEVRHATQSLFGHMISVTACPTCGGEGSVIRDLCKECQGEGRIRAEKTIDIDVPAGVSSNNYLTLRGQGAVGPRGGPAGDLIVALEVDEDPAFERHGDDLVYDLLVSFSQAALGAEFTVPHPEGPVKVKVPDGTQAGTVITVRGKGFPSVNHGRRGDLHVRVQVWTPTSLSAEQQELFRRVGELEGKPPTDEGGLT